MLSRMDKINNINTSDYILRNTLTDRENRLKEINIEVFKLLKK